MKLNAIIFLTCVIAGSSSCLAKMTPLQQIDTSNAPKSLGAYSQAIAVDLERTKNLIFVCGQVPLDPKTGQMIEHDIHQATNRTLDNVEAILKAAGSDWKYVVRMDVFLQNFDRDWDGMNEEYAKRFSDGVFPARQTVGVKMDDNTLVEISCIAIVPKTKK
jgi:2-iminobutanoate/2-iminopropanoate deaminase